MAYPDASWWSQLISWPPLQFIRIDHAVEDDGYLPELRLTCTDVEGQPSEEDPEEDEDEENPPLTLDVRTFPHNIGKVCRGIKFIDLLHGLRLHYLDNEDFIGPFYETEVGKEAGAGKMMLGRGGTGQGQLLEVYMFTF